MSKFSLQKQWNRLIKTMSKRVLNTNSRVFTQELYEALHTHCNMIAHYDKVGFIKARFWTLADFDQTLDAMDSSELGKSLLDKTNKGNLAMARFRIAQAEAARLIQQAQAMFEHARELQKQFNRPF